MKVQRIQGSSLIELVMVIVLVGILAVLGAQSISQPVFSFIENARRAALTDAAASALLRMSRDIRSALPNSIRITGDALELLAVVDGERYRTDPPGSNDARLSFTGLDDSFNTLGLLGPLNPVGGPAVSYASHRLAIYPLGQSGADPYQADANPAVDAVMTRAQTITVDDTTAPSPPGTVIEYRITLADDHRFPFESPAQRVFLVSGPVSYICSGTQLLRYEAYALAGVQPVPPGVTPSLVADQVQSCSFSYQAVGQRLALVTLVLELESDGEFVRLLRQVQVDNTP